MKELMMTSKQKKQILRVVEDTLDKMELSRSAAQTVLGSGRELQARFRGIVTDLSQPILKCISGDEQIVIDAVDGTELLKDAKDVFSYINPGFVSLGADEPGTATGKTPVRVCEIVKDATFAQIFGSLFNTSPHGMKIEDFVEKHRSDLEKICLTRHQVKEFVKNHRNWLRTDGYPTFFLFKSKNNFFVADVDVDSDGSLWVDVLRFVSSYVWFAAYRHRVVVPCLPAGTAQLAV